MKKFLSRIGAAVAAGWEQVKAEMADKSFSLDHARGLHRVRLPGCPDCDVAKFSDVLVKRLRCECHERGGHRFAGWRWRRGRLSVVRAGSGGQVMRPSLDDTCDGRLTVTVMAGGEHPLEDAAWSHRHIALLLLTCGCWWCESCGSLRALPECSGHKRDVERYGKLLGEVVAK